MNEATLPKEGVPHGSDPFTADWVILLFILMLLLLTWVRAAHPSRLKRVLDSVWAPRIIRQVGRDEEPLTHPASWALFLVTVLSGGLFLYQQNLHYDWDFLPPASFMSYSYCTLIVLGGALLKLLSLGLLRPLIGRDVGIREYMFHLLLILEALGILFVPITLLVSFMSSFPPSWGFIISYPLLGLALLLLIGRAIFIARSHAVPSFYIFLYLCTLEILPLIVLSKAFIDHY